MKQKKEFPLELSEISQHSCMREGFLGLFGCQTGPLLCSHQEEEVAIFSFCSWTLALSWEILMCRYIIFISKERKIWFALFLSLRSCSFIMFPACLRGKLLSAWKGVASMGLFRGRRYFPVEAGLGRRGEVGGGVQSPVGHIHSGRSWSSRRYKRVGIRAPEFKANSVP